MTGDLYLKLTRLIKGMKEKVIMSGSAGVLKLYVMISGGSCYVSKYVNCVRIELAPTTKFEIISSLRLVNKG